MIKLGLLGVVALGCLACGSKNSIAGTYEDRDWLVGTRVDTWKFTDREFSKQTQNTNRPHPSHLVTGTYTLGDKTITLTSEHYISYRIDGTVRSDQSPQYDKSETCSFSRDGDKLVIDAENKTIDGKRVLTPVR